MKTMIFKDWRRETINVKRDGKATKRTKEIWVSYFTQKEVKEIVINGHIAYYRVDELESEYGSTIYLYQRDGSLLTGMYRFGKDGMKEHKEPIRLNKKTMQIEHTCGGYQGPVGKGAGGVLLRINWTID